IVQIDLRGEQLGRRTKVDLGLVGDTKATIRALLPKLSGHENDRHLRTAREHYARARTSLDELATAGSGTRSHPQYVARVVDQLAAPDAIVTCDTGTPTLWAARYLTMNGRRRLLAPSTMAPWRMRYPRPSGRRSVIPAVRSSPCVAMAGSRCRWRI